MSVETLEEISKANKAQISQGLQIQIYCQTVKSQPCVDFSGNSKLKKYEEKINTRLKQAQTHADTYLNVIQPNILKNLSNISDYYSSQNTILTKLPETATKEQWLKALEALQTKATEYSNKSLETAISLRNLYNNFAKDAVAFAQTVLDLNISQGGNKQELEEIKKELRRIKSQIKGTIAGIVISGLAVAGGVFIIAVGSIAEFVTAGTSTHLVIMGGVLTVAGIGGASKGLVELKQLYATKADLLTKNTNLTAEVELAVAIEEGFSTLKEEVNLAMTAAQQMANAWQFLGNDLNHLSENLKNDIQSTDTLRTEFDANSILQTQLIQDITTIKQQMTGVEQLRIIPNRNMTNTIDVVVKEAKKYQ